jgi:hypothetical protein
MLPVRLYRRVSPGAVVSFCCSTAAIRYGLIAGGIVQYKVNLVDLV